MKIKFNGHSPTDREVEFTHDDKVRLFEIMKQEFLDHITYTRFNSAYTTSTERKLENFCNDFGVDAEYEKDRVVFFTASFRLFKKSMLVNSNINTNVCLDGNLYR